MSLGRKGGLAELDEDWVARLENVEVDPDDVKGIVLDYLMTNNMSAVANIFMQEAGIESTLLPQKNREVMESFQHWIHSAEYSSALCRLKELEYDSETHGSKLQRLYRRVAFKLHLLVTLRKISCGGEPDDVIAYARTHLQSAVDAAPGAEKENMKGEIDRVLLLLLLQRSRLEEVSSLERELISKLDPELLELLSLHLNLATEPRLTYLFKNLMHSQSALSTKHPRLDEKDFSTFVTSSRRRTSSGSRTGSEGGDSPHL